ncbi:MAG: response regulator [Verrucomicrobia bacterium]|nr:response regulator [Deltaproteobacteria bacterium]
MSIKILLADDSITIQKVVGIIFGSEDYTLTVVDNGKAAVEKARELNPDVLLIDALMPGMSGYEVCEAVRATPALATKPILLLTGSFEPFDETKAKNCGADDFLAKPFESQQIVTKVKELFDLGAARAGISTPAAALAEAEPVVPAFEEFVEELAAAPLIEEPAAANDIWGAFTSPEETTPVVETPPATAAPAVDEDIFAMISEEPEAHVEPVEAVEYPLSESTGSQWIPVEEETFEFEEEPTLESPVSAFNEPEPVAEDSAFEMDMSSPELPSIDIPAVPEQAAPAFNEPEAPAFAEPAPAPVQPVTADVVPLVTAVLTEDQLRAALAGASKDVIERIVWEVVPDLAEAMIKEAIRKIKEGM